MREATSSNPELRAARESARSSEYLTRSAWSGFFPQLNGSVGYNYGNTSGSSALSSTGATGSYSASVSASQNLFAGFQDRAKLAQARANLDEARASLQAARAKLSFELKSAYQNLHYAQESVKLASEIIKRREENLRLVELRFQSGRENKGSVLLAQAYLAQAELEALQAQNALVNARADLAQALGRDAFEPLEVRGAIPVSEPPMTIDPRVLAPATPERLQAVAREELARANLTVARSAFFPSLGISGQVGRQGSELFAQNNRWTVGVSLSFPLFSGGKDYYGAQSAVALSAAAAFNRENVDRALLAQLTETHSKLREAVARLKVEQAFFEAATTRSQIARMKYNNGLLSFEDWDLIENDLVTREKNRLQSLRDRVLAEASWERALGRGVIP